MKLRKATLADGPAVVALYREAQAFLAAQGIDQWQDGYPNEETFQEDVARGESWVLEDEALALEGRRDTGETTNRVFALQALYRQTRAGASV